MTTEKQIAANRLNALKSTGPRTPEGKTIAAQNSLTHGLLADRLLIYDENPDEFNVFYQAVLRDLAPVGPMEILLAERIIAFFWRLKRAGRMESALLNELCADQEDTERTLRPVRMAKFLQISFHGTDEDLDPSFPHPHSTLLGGMVKLDFAGSNHIAHLLRYESEMERGLYKTILELQKLQYIRKKNNADSEEQGANHATV
ncbi:MAG: hypothetical protein FJ263_00280 [Planctomycetes bacterium]|nr:hypothetical protein [Planctomycetota bacterium]